MIVNIYQKIHRYMQGDWALRCPIGCFEGTLHRYVLYTEHSPLAEA